MMNYGQAIEAMRSGCVVGRTSMTDRVVRLAHPNTSLQYFEGITDASRQPYTPTTDDQLAEDWVYAGGILSFAVGVAMAAMEAA
jgi:hypothetical protein